MPNRFILVLLLTVCCGAVAYAQPQSEQLSNLEFLSNIQPVEDDRYNDIWGYVADGREYALLAAFSGTSIVDVTEPENPVVKGFVQGPYSLWRDIKTLGHYAYVVHDANDDGFEEPGLQIIDLSPLPDGEPVLVNTFREEMGDGRVHNCFIDDRGYLWLVGGREFRQALVLSLEKPEEPEIVGRYEGEYWHDVYVKDNIAFGFAIYKRELQIMDVTDIANPVMLSETPYAGAFTHNGWATADNNFLITTDEYNEAPLHFWNTTDKEAPEITGTYHPGLNAMPHNAFIDGDHAYVSYYNDGLKILDISDRNAPFEIAHYDSFLDDNYARDEGFDGAWGTYPYLPSGNILISDMTYGLVVVGFDRTQQGGRVTGTVFNKETNEPLSGVSISRTNAPDYLGQTQMEVGASGNYVYPTRPDNLDLEFYKRGFVPEEVKGISITAGASVQQDVYLQPLEQAQVIVSVVDNYGNAVPSMDVQFVSLIDEWQDLRRSDNDGKVYASLVVDEYVVQVPEEWGIRSEGEFVQVTESGTIEVTLVVQFGYYEDFSGFQFTNWSFVDDSLRGDTEDNTWRRDLASDPQVPGFTNVDAFGLRGPVMFSRARVGAAVMTTPQFDGTSLDEPTLECYKFFLPVFFDEMENADDTLSIQVSNDDGATWTTVFMQTEKIDTDWELLQIPLDVIEVTTTMRVRWMNSENDREGNESFLVRRPSYALIDNVAIVSARDLTDVEDSTSEFANISLTTYPNPAHETLQVAWSLSSEHTVQLSLSNLLGATVLTTFAPPGANSAALSLGDVDSGVYFVTVSNGSSSVVQKVYVQK